ncbi:MAG: acetate--CoA ligase [Ilumatobacteraceae bacterium]
MTDAIESLGDERRRFAPSAQFAGRARVTDPGVYVRANADPTEYWARRAAELLTWASPWHDTLQWDLPDARWFVGGSINASFNCLDRHVLAGIGDRVAIHWEGEPGDTRTLTYSDLHAETQRCANVLASLGVRAGDRVNIYLPLIPEAIVAMLACARIGAAHSVVFGGFSAQALADRINDAGAKVLITADGGWRRGEVSPLKPHADVALESTPTIEHVLVVQRCGNSVSMRSDRDLWWHEAMALADARHHPSPFDAEQLLFLLYTSGTTGRPKGIMHTTGGYLTHVASTFRDVFDHRPGEDVYWCTADVGWITGHSYVAYGPLLNGATQVMYEGVPNYPDPARWWSIIERYRVTTLYTAPTAIRTFMKWGEDGPARHDLTSLRLLGSVGEPINPEAWMWYRRVIGGDRCPIVDTWWQTETGGIMISPLPGVTATKPGSATQPLPGVRAEIVNDAGDVIERGGGYLTIAAPWPGMLRGIWGDAARFRETYWSRFPGRYFAGDGARTDDDGYLWLLGRVDDVMNVSGHRISTTEVESSIVSHPCVAEAAVVGVADPVTGQAIVAYVTLKAGESLGESDVRNHVARDIGPIAKPKTVYFTPELPKTRSGKIMRRLLRDVAEGRNLGDTTTLADAAVMDELRRRAVGADAD